MAFFVADVHSLPNIGGKKKYINSSYNSLMYILVV